MPANTSPILLFTYNRPDHTRRTLEALCANRLAEKSSLFIYCDGPKKDSSPEQLQRISDVRKIVRETPWPGKLELVEREVNLGLAESVIRGVTATTSTFGSAIVLEDDILCSQAFLDYMNFALGHFKNEDTVGSINSWMFNIHPRLLPKYFFLHGGDCWGWATWGRAWELFEQDSNTLIEKLRENKQASDHFQARWMDLLKAQAAGRISSWHIRWHASLILKNKLGLFPGRSYILNIGNDDSGTHRAESAMGTYKYKLNQRVDSAYIENLEIDHSNYVRMLMESNRGLQVFQNRVRDHLKYRYPRLAGKLNLNRP